MFEDKINLLCKNWDSEEEKAEFRRVMLDLIGPQERNYRASLYDSLHYVGDDPIKAAIEDDLKAILDKDTYALVEAMFHWNSTYDILTWD